MNLGSFYKWYYCGGYQKNVSVVPFTVGVLLSVLDSDEVWGWGLEGLVVEGA